MPADSLKLIKFHLEESIGDIGTKVYQKSISKLNIGENPSKSDIEKLISHLEGMIIPLYGNDKSKAMLGELRKKLIEEDAEIPKNINAEINTFLANNKLPNEKDIIDYAKYLAMKYGGNAKKVEQDLTEKVKIHIKAGISRKKINEEIDNFLKRYRDPTQKDVDDFIHYIRLLKLNFQENELREQLEKERLYRKFHGRQEVMEEISELDQFINFVKTSNDREAISKLMQKQGLSYLIKDDSGISEKSLSELVNLMTPNESDMKDALEEMGLEHLINKKQ